VVTGSCFFATVKTRKGAVSSDRRDSTPGVSLVREKTSKGPAKSSTSTASNNRIATLYFSIEGRELQSALFGTFIFDYPQKDALSLVNRCHFAQQGISR
jgi:hypothetical protein